MSNGVMTEEYIQTLVDNLGHNEYQRQVMGEWVVAPEPRTAPNRKYFSIPANEADLIRDSFAENDQVRVRMSLSYENVAKMMQLMEEAVASGELMLPDDEVILEARIDLRSQYRRTTGLCTPHRNPITGYDYAAKS